MKAFDAIFISDLHLHPADTRLCALFSDFLNWASHNTDVLYILGDFFHVWAGDDVMDDWSTGIATQLASLGRQGVRCYFMPGNRDFLVGERFSALAGWTVLPDPCVQLLGDRRVLLTHGDRYCTLDKKHQYFRALTRHPWFMKLFLQIPQQRRKQWVNQVRRYSQSSHLQKTAEMMDVVPLAVLKDCWRHQVPLVIHGHTHRPKCVHYQADGHEYKRYVLSDWDDNPTILGYNARLEDRFQLETYHAASNSSCPSGS